MKEEETILAKMNATPDSVFLIDLKGTVLAANETSVKRFDRLAEEIVGRNIFQLLPENLARPWREHVDRVIHNGQPVQFMDELQGSTIENSITPLCDEHGTVTRLVLISRDITERKRAEEELQEKQERFRIASQSVSDVIWEWDIVNGTLDWFGEIDNLLGYARGEFPRTIEAWEQLIVAEDRSAVMAALDRHLTTSDQYAMEYRVRKRNGNTAYWQDRGIALRSADGKAIRMIGAILDITERKQAEQALQESERKFRDTIKNLDEGYYRCTLEGLLLEHNVAFNQIFSFPNDEDLKGKKLPDFWQNPEDRKQYLHELSTQGFVRNFPINAKKIDGTQVVVMASAHLVTDEKDQMTCIEGTFTDFTERKRMEKELIQAKDNLERRVSERTRELQEAISYNRNLIEASLDPLVMIGPEGKITDVNQATETITGRTRQELIGTDFSDYFTDPEKALAGYRQAFAEGLVRDYELLLRHADGHATPVRYNASVYRDSLGRVVGVFAAARDVTEWKNAQNKLVTNMQLLDETGRLARVGGWELDLRKNELSWSEMLYQIHEIGPAYQPTNETAINFYAPEAIPAISEAVRRAIEEGEPYDVELPLITAKGNRRWVRTIGQAYWSNGEIVKIGGVSQDITDRKLAENELKRHRDHLEELVAERTAELTRSRELLLEAETVARMGSWEWDVNRDLLTGSAEFYRLFDVVPEQLANLPQLIGLLHADDRERVQRDIADAMEQRSMYDIDYRVILPDGNWRHINDRGRMYVAEKGKPLRMVGTCMDITERKRAEEELQEKQERFRIASQSVSDVIWEWDIVNGTLDWFGEIDNLLGYARGEFPRTIEAWEQLIVAEDRSAVMAALDRHLTTSDQYAMEYRVRKRNGNTAYWQDRGIALRSADGKAIRMIGAILDITERRRVEDALRESEVKYRNLVESISDVIYEIDSQGVIVYISPIVKDVMGYDPADVIGKNFIEFVYKDDRSLLMVLLSDLRTGRTTPSEYRLTDKSGDLRWVRTRTRPIMEDGRFTGGARGTIIDITERKQAEEAQRKAEESYRSIFENAVEGIFQTTADGRFLSANPALAYILGYESPEDLMASVTSIGGQLYVSHEAREEHLRVVTEKGQVKGFEAQVRRKDGSIRWISMNTRLVRDDVGNFVEGFAEDITERRRAEEELAKKAEELARSNAELEQFASVASHDLQEPLRMISSYVQLLARHNQGKLDADSQEFIAFAADGATRMQALIQDLLAFSRVGTRGKPFVPTDCEAVLERALNHLKVAIEESGARITSDPLPMLRADDSQLVQLFQNLVGNALKFYRPGVPPVIHIGAKRSGQDWVFAVCDNGIGIPAEQKQRVFEIFQRLHSRGEYPGTGIGLAVCRKIVERHGGRIWVESAVGEGSTFTFALPQGNGNRITSPDEPSK